MQTAQKDISPPLLHHTGAFTRDGYSHRGEGKVIGVVWCVGGLATA